MVCTALQISLCFYLIEWIGLSGGIPYKEKCYTADGKSVCFFQHVDDTSSPRFQWKTWNGANDICLEQNGTLPIIRNEVIQRAFQDYVESLLLNNHENMWTAGRQVVENQWKWINGEPFNLPRHTVANDGKVENSIAVLTDQLLFQSQRPSVISNYICQYFGVSCQSRDAIQLTSGCLLTSSAETLSFYAARNRCLEKGVDLAVVDNEEDLKKFQQVFSKYGKTTKLWVGLQKQQWKWKTNRFQEHFEVKYSNWETDEGFNPQFHCMSISPKEFKWKQLSCDFYMRFICQNGTGSDLIKPANIENNDETNLVSSNIPMATAVGGILFLILVTIGVTLITVTAKKKKKKKRKATKDKSRGENSYQHLGNRVLPPDATTDDNGKYTKLQLPLRPPPQQQQDQRNQQTMQTTASSTTDTNPYYESLYDDNEIDYIQGPCYIELQQSL